MKTCSATFFTLPAVISFTTCCWKSLRVPFTESPVHKFARATFLRPQVSHSVMKFDTKCNISLFFEDQHALLSVFGCQKASRASSTYCRLSIVGVQKPNNPQFLFTKPLADYNLRIVNKTQRTKVGGSIRSFWTSSRCRLCSMCRCDALSDNQRIGLLPLLRTQMFDVKGHGGLCCLWNS